MSTHSYIGIENSDGSITYAYCHFDGYPLGVGADIVDVGWDEASEVLKEGEMRCWGESYHEDPPHTVKDVNAYLTAIKEGPVSFGYLLRWQGQWEVTTPGMLAFQPLRPVIETQRSVQGSRGPR